MKRGYCLYEVPVLLLSEDEKPKARQIMERMISSRLKEKEALQVKINNLESEISLIKRELIKII